METETPAPPEEPRTDEPGVTEEAPPGEEPVAPSEGDVPPGEAPPAEPADPQQG